MEEIELKGNSFKQRNKEEEERRIEKIVNGQVKQKKKSTGRQFAEKFINEDASNVKQYVLFDILVPALKDMVSAAISAATDMIIYGEVKGRSSRNIRTINGNTNYNGISTSRNREQRAATVRDRFVIDDVYFDERFDAEKVLDDLCDQIDEYGRVSAYDFYGACGLSCDSSLRNWGWFDLNTASVVRTRDGDYTIKLPKIVNIK